jgi:hypothetical protein
MKKFLLLIYQGPTPPIPGTDRWKALVAQKAESVLVNGTPGILSWFPNGKPMAVLGFVVANERIVESYVLSDPTASARYLRARLRRSQIFIVTAT